MLVGAIVPIDGAWRATGTMVAVGPREADSLVEMVHEATYAVVRDVSGDDSLAEPPPVAPFGQAEPLSVYACEDEERHPVVAGIVGRIVGVMLPALLAAVYKARATPPTMTNTDGDIMEMITARVAVADIAALPEQVASHPDFEVTDAATITWYGTEVPVSQRQVMLAEARARFGGDAVDEPDEPQRWVRGTLSIDDDVVRVEVNSRRRLDRLITLLGRFGAEPNVVDETRVDPAQDLPWPAYPRLAVGGAAPAAQGWENQWLDETVPALGGYTPREAVHSEFRPHLEAMLRQFEYDADMCRFAGKNGVDTAWLRDALGMPDYLDE